jgi:hypothetical protein
VDPDAGAALGVLVAAGPRAGAEAERYSRVIESVREGFLLHYGEPRIVITADRDLALLAGDYLYARGLSMLAAIGDAESVAELADLISLCAQAQGRRDGDVPALWLAAAMAMAAGTAPPHAAAKAIARQGRPAASELWAWTSLKAAQSGLDEELGAAAEAVGFAP